MSEHTPPGKVCMDPDIPYGPGLHAWERQKRSLREKWSKEEKRQFLKTCSPEEVSSVLNKEITLDQLWLKKNGKQKI